MSASNLHLPTQVDVGYLNIGILCHDAEFASFGTVLSRMFKKSVATLKQQQSNFSGSNTFGTMKICSRQGQFEPVRVDKTSGREA